MTTEENSPCCVFRVSRWLNGSGVVSGRRRSTKLAVTLTASGELVPVRVLVHVHHSNRFTARSHTDEGSASLSRTLQRGLWRIRGSNREPSDYWTTRPTSWDTAHPEITMNVALMLDYMLCLSSDSNTTDETPTQFHDRELRTSCDWLTGRNKSDQE